MGAKTIPQMKPPIRKWSDRAPHVLKRKEISGSWAYSFITLSMTLALFGGFTAVMGHPSPIDSLAVQYLGGEGFFIQGTVGAVLIDALFDLNLPPGSHMPPSAHDHPDRALLDRITQGGAPFDPATLALVTHGHADHFTSDAASAFLYARPETRLIAPVGVATQLRTEAGFDPAQVLCPADSTVAHAAWSHDGIGVTGWRLAHSGRSTLDHWIYRVQLGDSRLVHLGDANTDSTAWAALGWTEPLSVDLALVPFWFFQSEAGIATLKQYIRARDIIVMHLGPFDFDKVWSAIQAQAAALAPFRLHAWMDKAAVKTFVP